MPDHNGNGVNNYTTAIDLKNMKIYVQLSSLHFKRGIKLLKDTNYCHA
jgi:hypothetical protein